MVVLLLASAAGTVVPASAAVLSKRTRKRQQRPDAAAAAAVAEVLVLVVRLSVVAVTGGGRFTGDGWSSSFIPVPRPMYLAPFVTMPSESCHFSGLCSLVAAAGSTFQMYRPCCSPYNCTSRLLCSRWYASNWMGVRWAKRYQSDASPAPCSV